jgi:glycosyltransferase involved in cell wall biosynthesis
MTARYPKIEHLLDVKVDIVHACDFGHQVATSKPYIVTVHDIGPLIYAEYFSKEAYWAMQNNLRYALRKAAAFICVSHATADTLLEYARDQHALDLSDRTHVAHEGVTEQFLQRPDPSTVNVDGKFTFLNEPYILAVGKTSPRKNLVAAINALKKLQSSIPHHLVTVGGDGWDFEEVKNLATDLVDRIHFLGYVSDQTLSLLYNKASLFIYPSLFEGFGLPVLEAMACGCPVITSRISSLPEVAGDAAILVDPRNIEEVVGAIEAICKDDVLADQLRLRGVERAKLFSWKKCAGETLAVYDTMIT